MLIGFFVVVFFQFWGELFVRNPDEAEIDKQRAKTAELKKPGGPKA